MKSAFLFDQKAVEIPLKMQGRRDACMWRPPIASGFGGKGWIFQPYLRPKLKMNLTHPFYKHMTPAGVRVG